MHRVVCRVMFSLIELFLLLGYHLTVVVVVVVVIEFDWLCNTYIRARSPTPSTKKSLIKIVNLSLPNFGIFPCKAPLERL